jgi:hypothetical protein
MLAGAVIAALAAVVAFFWPRQRKSEPTRPVKLLLIAILSVYGAGGVASLLGVPLAGGMFVFDDAGVPLDTLFRNYMLPMLLTIVWFGLGASATSVTMAAYTHERLAGVLLLSAAVGLYLMSFPTAPGVFELIWAMATSR